MRSSQVRAVVRAAARERDRVVGLVVDSPWTTT
jgi:hypothetical protein